MDNKVNESKIASFTMVYNESLFLPLWLQYYGVAVGEKNLFVIDHGSNDGSTISLGEAQIIRIPRNNDYDEEKRAEFISKFQSTLLSYYDVVIFSDVDEFLIPDPDKYDGLVDFINRRCSNYITSIGLELIHNVNYENAIDLHIPILSQRKCVQFSHLYCKTLISRSPLVWNAGFHSCNVPPLFDRDIYLFHLKRFDLARALDRLAVTRAISWSANAVMLGHSGEHRLSDDDFMNKIFPYSKEDLRIRANSNFEFSAAIEDFLAFRFHEGLFFLIPPRFSCQIPGLGAVTRIDRSMEELAEHLRFADQGIHGGTRRNVSKVLWGNISPYDNFPHRRFRVDKQGWNSEHPLLRESIKVVRPPVIVEIGVWKGASVIYMAAIAKELTLDCTIIAIDTWLGSEEHWNNPEWKEDLLISYGYPNIYFTFLTNVMDEDLQNIIVPLPLDSRTAYLILKSRNLRPSMVHLDASLDYASVIEDLRRWWSLLAPGGVFVIDDYDESGEIFREVRDGVKEFLREIQYERFESLSFKCRFFKPLSQVEPGFLKS